MGHLYLESERGRVNGGGGGVRRVKGVGGRGSEAKSNFAIVSLIHPRWLITR